jgi:uncharacterized membrane protein YhaH (DUF805 family)
MRAFLRNITWPLSFSGTVSRAVFAPLALLLLITPQLAALAVNFDAALNSEHPVVFWLTPQPAFALVSGTPSAFASVGTFPALGLYLSVLAWLLIVWVMAALSFRRAIASGGSGWLAVATVAPLVQIPAVLWLCLAPPKPGRATQPAAANENPAVRPRGLSARAAMLGVVAGAAVCVIAVGLGTLIFGVYGYGLFVASPLLVGAITAYLANKGGDIGAGETFKIIAAAMAFGSLALLAFALEGAVCLVMAFPLALGAGAVGGLLGRRLALSRRSSPQSAMLSVLILPAIFGAEREMPSTLHFTQSETLIVAASPQATWRAMLHMQTIPDTPALPFRLGLAYPVRGEVVGEGVGAIRHGYFSTGVANERITEWSPGRRLAFVILNDAPALHELSPYDHVHAPHVNGYFRTSDAAFTLTPLADGRTRMTLTTRHSLDLQPAPYWSPIAHWAIHENKIRVLTQIRRQAEAEARAGAPAA